MGRKESTDSGMALMVVGIDEGRQRYEGTAKDEFRLTNNDCHLMTFNDWWFAYTPAHLCFIFGFI